MNVPPELRYTSDHEWVSRDASRETGNVVRIGITDHAQDALGDVVYVQVPEIGDTVTAGQNFGEVESTKSVSEIYAPVAGTIAAVNEALTESPGLLNDDPYGDGWICAIEMSEPGAYDGLLDAAAYRALIEG